MSNEEYLKIYDLDYFFYEDASDEQKTEGTLLPLWNFTFKEIFPKMEVTSLAWNPKYRDLFAVGFGSCEYQISLKTLVLIFSDQMSLRTMIGLE